MQAPNWGVFSFKRLANGRNEHRASDGGDPMKRECRYWRVTEGRWLVAGLATIALSSPVHADPPSSLRAAAVHQRLGQALLCQVDPAFVITELAESNNGRGPGYKAEHFGRAMTWESNVDLDEPLVIEGFETRRVSSGPTNPNAQFGAFTWARFVGDPAPMIAALKLQPQPADGDVMADFIRPIRDPEDDPTIVVCPPTIMLSTDRAQPGTFLLGCGWCNG